MSVRSRWLFIFVGSNATGKTTIQKILVEFIAAQSYQRLPSNTAYPIIHRYFIRKFRRLFVAGRSYQELLNQGQYTLVRKYFDLIDAAGPDVDLAFAATHPDATVASQMISEAHKRFWNVSGVFLSNAVELQPAVCADIGALDWDERWMIENPRSDDEEVQSRQMLSAAETILQMLIERTRGW
jgi:hypothetical protein